MSRPEFEQLSRDLWSASANDRLKVQWRPWVAWSTVLAAVLHVAAFGLWPTWERARAESDPLQNFLQLEWVSVLEARSPPNTDPAPAIQIGAIPDSIPDEADLIAAASSTGRTIATLSEAFRERLTGRAAPTPTITQGQTEAERTAVGESVSDEGSIDVDGSVSAAEFAELLGANPLDLERLSAVRPELVLVTPAAWILLRNPTEVERFLLGTYRRGLLDRSASGSVSVALWINDRGSVEWAEISQSSGRSDMDRIALELFSEVAAFRPARAQGVAIPRSVIFSLRFPWY